MFVGKLGMKVRVGQALTAQTFRPNLEICMTEDLIDFGQLRTFLAVVDQNGFRRAATFLNVSQPSVSQQMRRLEKKLGRDLFVRSKQSAKLTTYGEALVIFARSIFSVTERVRQYFAQTSLSGILRIGLNEDFARTALPAVLDLFSRNYPDFELQVECGTGQQLFRSLDEGQFEVVVGKCLPQHVRGDFLWREPLVWVGHNDHAVSVSDPVPLALPPPPNELWEAVLQALTGANRTWRIRFQSSSLTGVEAAIAAGLGVCALGKSMRSPDLTDISGSSGLPALPDCSFFIDHRPGRNGLQVEAFASLIREAALFTLQSLA